MNGAFWGSASGARVEQQRQQSGQQSRQAIRQLGHQFDSQHGPHTTPRHDEHREEADQRDSKLVLIKRRTRLEELVVRYNTVSQAQFYITQMGADFNDYLNEHNTYQLALRETIAILERQGRLQIVNREHVPNYLFGKRDTVIALGQDGLVANTLKYLQGQRLIGVNPDPSRWDGVLLPFEVRDLHKIVPDTLCGKRGVKEISLAKATLNDGQTLYAVNDLFIGRKTHVSARYRIYSGDRAEQQSSSGIIVSTGMGATGWLKSVLAGAEGISRYACGHYVSDLDTFLNSASGQHRQEAVGEQEGKTEGVVIPAENVLDNFGWDASHLYFSVREPFPSRSSGASLVFGAINDRSPLQVESQMPEDGVIFSDGVESDYLAFNSGLKATIGLAEKHGVLVV
ncbi:sugar kinase [Paenibacillus oryzae]|uniref:sugar kinase n=1 Tax=Paenibacillus oryzae TaxID=1844972 RepID=UPI000AE8BA74|nr:sugar kinase [Paenibacillus oryzae]